MQSSDGRIADTGAVLDAAHRVGALTVVDTTQATGWLPLPLDRVDAAVCSAYKWLCCPRGTAFMVTSARVLSEVVPHAASWFAADDMHAGYYGPPLRLAADARRFDGSPAWFAWMGAVTSLGVLAEIGMTAIHDHDVELADGLRDALGHEPTGSAIVSVGGDDLEARLAPLGIKAATRANGCRLSFHLYNDHDDVAAAAAALVTPSDRVGLDREPGRTLNSSARCRPRVGRLVGRSTLGGSRGASRAGQLFHRR